MKIKMFEGDSVIQLSHKEVQAKPMTSNQIMLTDEMTFTLLKPLALNSIINNLTKSLGGLEKSHDGSRQVLDLKSPLNHASLEFESTNLGSRPSSTKVGQPRGFRKRQFT